MVETIKIANNIDLKYCPDCRAVYYNKEDCDCNELNDETKQIVEQRLKQVKEGKVFSSKEVREKLFGDKK